MKKLLSMLFAVLFIVSSVPASAATCSSEPQIGVLYNTKNYPPEFWDMLEKEYIAATSIPLNTTNNHIQVEYHNNRTPDEWDALDEFMQNTVPDMHVTGTDLMSRAPTVPSSFFNTNNKTCYVEVDGVIFNQTFYSDYYYPAGEGNRLYLGGSIWLENSHQADDGDIRLELYEYSPNYGVYGVSVNFNYSHTGYPSNTTTLQSRYILDATIYNLQTNNLYYFMFVNESGQTVDSGWFSIDGKP